MMVATVAATSASAQLKLTPQNIDRVVKEMTLEEKATLLVGYTTSESYFGIPSNPDPNAKEMVLGAAGNTAPIARLGIPQTVLTDGPAGVRISAKRPGDTNTYYCTGFPIGTLLASTWNTPLVQRVGEAIGNETLEYGCDVLLGPGMNIMRSPLCGRNFEYYSEDPFLTGYIAAAMVNGIQSQGVGVSAKHFAGNNQESNRLYNNSVVSQRALREIYLKGFEIMVRKSDPWTIMSSYNYLNGPWTQENYELLTTILRDEWGFKGIVMTDWTNTRHTDRQVAAGNDLMEPGNGRQVQDIINGVKNGTIKQADVDRNVRRVLQYIVKTPHFRGYPFSNKPDIAAHARLTRETAPEGMVLLKNEPLAGAASEKPVLPLDPAIKRVALFGITSYKFYAGGTGSGDVNKPYVVDLCQGLGNAGLQVDDTLTAVFTKYNEYGKVEVEAEMGHLSTNWFFPRPRLREPQLGPKTYQFAAKNNDMAIVTIGRSSGEGGDRAWSDFNVNADEVELLKNTVQAFHRVGKPVVVILNVGGVVETESWSHLADAILLAWQPGMEGGNSVADVLTGKVNPSGRLTMTWPISATDHPSTKNFPQDMDMYSYREQIGWGSPLKGRDYTNHEEDIYVGYRYFDTFKKEVAYPFGYGLSYTTFKMSNEKLEVRNGVVTVSVTVKNTGSVAGKEVAQVYVTAPKGSLEKPAQELKAFAKTRELKPGEQQVLTMQIPVRMLASFDEAGSQWLTDGGQYTFSIGASSRDIRCTATANIAKYTEKVNNALAPKVKLNLLKQ